MPSSPRKQTAACATDLFGLPWTPCEECTFRGTKWRPRFSPCTCATALVRLRAPPRASFDKMRGRENTWCSTTIALREQLFRDCDLLSKPGLFVNFGIRKMQGLQLEPSLVLCHPPHVFFRSSVGQRLPRKILWTRALDPTEHYRRGMWLAFAAACVLNTAAAEWRLPSPCVRGETSPQSHGSNCANARRSSRAEQSARVGVSSRPGLSLLASLARLASPRLAR